MVHSFNSMKIKITLGAFVCYLVLLGGCIGSTRHAAIPGSCPKALTPNDRILVGVIPGLSAYHSHQLYQQLEQVFSKKGISTAYVVEQEFELAQKGIKAGAAFDTANLMLMQQAGYTYFLQLAVMDAASGTVYSHTSVQDQREIQQGYSKTEADESKATVHFKLYSTENKEVYTLVTTTKLSGISLPGNKQEGSLRSNSTFNLSSASLATQKALKKGASEMLDNCKVAQ